MSRTPNSFPYSHFDNLKLSTNQPAYPALLTPEQPRGNYIISKMFYSHLPQASDSLYSNTYKKNNYTSSQNTASIFSSSASTDNYFTSYANTGSSYSNNYNLNYSASKRLKREHDFTNIQSAYYPSNPQSLSFLKSSNALKLSEHQQNPYYYDQQNSSRFKPELVNYEYNGRVTAAPTFYHHFSSHQQEQLYQHAKLPYQTYNTQPLSSKQHFSSFPYHYSASISTTSKIYPTPLPTQSYLPQKNKGQTLYPEKDELQLKADAFSIDVLLNKNISDTSNTVLAK